MQGSGPNQPQQPFDPTQSPGGWGNVPPIPPPVPPTPPPMGGSMPNYPYRPEVTFDAIGEAWQMITANMGLWIPAILIFFMVSGAVGGVGNLLGSGGMHFPMPRNGGSPFPGGTYNQPAVNPLGLGLQLVFSFIQVLVQLVMMGGLYRMAIKQFRGQTPAIGDLFSTTDVLGPLVVAGILTMIAYVVGLCACGVGALVVSGLLMFTVPLIVDRGMAPVEAMTLSFETLKSQWLMASLFIFVVGLCAGIGIFACCVGIIFTYPIAILAPAILYRNFFLAQPQQAAYGGGYPPPPGSYPPAGNYPSSPMGPPPVGQ